jgi:DNA sulfur modification protein DndE
MLPNRMTLSRETEEQLKRLRLTTGITPNVSSRIAFFRSIEAEHTYSHKDDTKLDGSLTLDKITWLGKTQVATELLLKQKYPMLNSKQLSSAWAFHVTQGISNLRNMKELLSLIKAITKE